jgi:hypothetical protein
VDTLLSRILPYYPGRRHMAASLRAFVDLAKEMVFRNRAAS